MEKSIEIALYRRITPKVEDIAIWETERKMENIGLVRISEPVTVAFKMLESVSFEAEMHSLDKAAERARKEYEETVAAIGKRRAQLMGG